MMIAIRRSLGQWSRPASQFRQGAVVRFSGLAEDNLQVLNLRQEGKNVDDNYSLLVDGVVNSKNAYRNARTITVVNKLPAKVENGKILLKNIDYFGNETVVEAGDTISQEDFNNSLESTRNYLSSGRDLFVEDSGLGAYSPLRVGTRIISDNPAHAFIFRSLLINIPARVPEHLQRFNGWNMNPKTDEEEFDRTWNGTTYDFVSAHEAPKRGERPIVAYIGGNNNTIGVQFEQIRSKGAVVVGTNMMAGANIIAGEKSSIRGIINALTLASTAMINSENTDAVALPSLVVTKNGTTTLIVGQLSDLLIAKACSSGTLYGAYGNVVTPLGVSALFNGVVIPASLSTQTPSFSGFFAKEIYPSVVSNDSTVRLVNPDNFTFKPTTVVFVGSESSLTVDEAITKFVQLSGDESKVEVARRILSAAKIVGVNSENDALSFVV